MKKVLIVTLSLMLLMGCSNKLENEKNDYLAYKSDLQNRSEFDSKEELDFNTYFDIDTSSDEKIVYTLTIDKAAVNMHNIIALLIHDSIIDEAFPTVGIFSEKEELLVGEDKKIVLTGSIDSNVDAKDINFKLYLEYTLDDGELNKVYYDLNRG